MHDVISAFLDNEPFDGQELSTALATPDGRELLLDLIALRAVVHPALSTAVPAGGSARRPRWIWLSAAAVLVALAAGYQAGRWSDRGAAQVPGTSASGLSAPPAPTSEFRFEPGVNWTDASASGGT